MPEPGSLPGVRRSRLTRCAEVPRAHHRQPQDSRSSPPRAAQVSPAPTPSCASIMPTTRSLAVAVVVTPVCPVFGSQRARMRRWSSRVVAPVRPRRCRRPPPASIGGRAGSTLSRRSAGCSGVRAMQFKSCWSGRAMGNRRHCAAPQPPMPKLVHCGREPARHSAHRMMSEERAGVITTATVGDIGNWASRGGRCAKSRRRRNRRTPGKVHRAHSPSAAMTALLTARALPPAGETDLLNWLRSGMRRHSVGLLKQTSTWSLRLSTPTSRSCRRSSHRGHRTGACVFRALGTATLGAGGRSPRLNGAQVLDVHRVRMTEHRNWSGPLPSATAEPCSFWNAILAGSSTTAQAVEQPRATSVLNLRHPGDAMASYPRSRPIGWPRRPDRRYRRLMPWRNPCSNDRRRH